MKKYLLYLFLIALPLKSFTQENILNQMQGLSLKGDMVFAVEGYMMTIQKENGSLGKKGIQKIKNKYNLKDIISEYSDKNLKWENWVIENKTKIKGLPDVEGFQKCYLLPQSNDRMMVVLLQSASGRDSIIEKAFMEALFSRKLSNYTTDNWTAEKVDFAGREITLGDVCQWVSPQNVHCASFGQMAWSIFKTEKEADINTKILIATNNNSGRYKIIKEESIEILFENIPTQAKRYTYKINTSKLLSGGRNTLIVYYVTQKVRDQYLSCIMTQYLEKKDDYSLPMLLQEVMSID